SPYIFLSTPPATTRIYPLSLHDALPICAPVATEIAAARRAVARAGAGDDRRRLRRARGAARRRGHDPARRAERGARRGVRGPGLDRKSTRLNSSHVAISYAVFCLKKKKK